jgi:NDP-sugar pyrophosphorylase family protein
MITTTTTTGSRFIVSTTSETIINHVPYSTRSTYTREAGSSVYKYSMSIVNAKTGAATVLPKTEIWESCELIPLLVRVEKVKSIEYTGEPIDIQEFKDLMELARKLRNCDVRSVLF